MLQPDITDLLFDPELGAQRFIINRTMGTWEKGRFIETVEQIHAIGNIQPAAPAKIEQFPEGDRKRGIIVIRTTTPVFDADGYSEEAPDPPETPQKEHGTDEIIWRGNPYKVLKATLWGDFGWYEAFATRK